MRDIKFRVWDKQRQRFSKNNMMGLDGVISSSHPEHYMLMQYTGLLDNHGVEIYEGDILTHKVQGNRFVEFGSPKTSYAGYMLVNKDGMRGTLQDTERLYEVIGNIYENPELIY